MESLTEVELERFRYGYDVNKRAQLYGLTEKTIYHGEWISRKADRICYR